MRILYVTQHFPPETGAAQARAYDMTLRLVNRGHEVQVLTGFPNYPSGTVPSEYRGKLWDAETLDNIRVLRTYLVPDTKRSAWVRVANYGSFCISSSIAGLLLSDFDLVYATVPQLLVGLSGLIISRLRKAKFALEVRDLWVDFAEMLGQLQNRRMIAQARKLESYLYKCADRLIVVTPGYKRFLANRDVGREKISVITNGTDTEFFRPGLKDNWVRRRYGLSGKFVVLYAGNMGLAQGLKVTLDAATRLVHERNIHFLYVGEGAEKEFLMDVANKRSLSNVTFVDQQSRSQIRDFMSAADCFLVTLRPHPLFDITIPSKLFDCMAMGRPILTGIGGDVRDIVLSSECGLVFDPRCPDELAERIRFLSSHPSVAESMGRRGRAVVKERFERDILAKKLESVLTSVL